EDRDRRGDGGAEQLDQGDRVEDHGHGGGDHRDQSPPSEQCGVEGHVLPCDQAALAAGWPAENPVAQGQPAPTVLVERRHCGRSPLAEAAAGLGGVLGAHGRGEVWSSATWWVRCIRRLWLKCTASVTSAGGTPSDRAASRSGVRCRGWCTSIRGPEPRPPAVAWTPIRMRGTA